LAAAILHLLRDTSPESGQALQERIETLKSLVTVPSRQPLEATRALFANRQAALEAMAERYRLLLYLTSLMLLALLVRLGLRCVSARSPCDVGRNSNMLSPRTRRA
jgi:hypothetical protein